MSEEKDIYGGNTLEALQEKIDAASRIAFFGGAGVSTESGIPDFRGTGGLYHQLYKYPPETILSHEFFWANTAEFYRYYTDKMVGLDAKPNAAHKKLAELEKAGKLLGIATQNIDGLHQEAGSKTVYELHGSVKRNYCTKCRTFYEEDVIVAAGRRGKAEMERNGLSAAPESYIPRCPKCGGVIKPDVVLYGESLDDETVEGAVMMIRNADLLIVGGTSLNVYPAAGLIRYFRGDLGIVLLNKQPTSYDGLASVILRGNIGDELGQIKVR
jgi:NAD-dependent deacetylase